MITKAFAQGELLRVSQSARVLTCDLRKFCIDDSAMMNRWQWERITFPTEYAAYSTKLNIDGLIKWLHSLGEKYNASTIIYRCDPVEHNSIRSWAPPWAEWAENWRPPPDTYSACVFIMLDDEQDRLREKRQKMPRQDYGRQFAMIVFKKEQDYGMVLHTHGDCITIQVQQLGTAAIFDTFESPPDDGIWVWEGEVRGRPGNVADYSDGEWRRPHDWEWQQLRLNEDPFRSPWVFNEKYFDTLGSISKHLQAGGLRWFHAEDKPRK